MNSCRILIVEDDPVIAGAMAEHLKSWGHRPVCVRDFQHVTAEFAASQAQMVLLDVSLPFFNGYYWCAEIRKLSQVPILFISSAADNMNQIMAMNMGGDDFLAKPFDLAVLSAKVQALVRRAYDFAGPAAQVMPCGGGVLNVSDGTLSAGETKLELTWNELKILQMLLENRGRVVSRESLMTRLWESDAFVDENTLTVNIARLRRKLRTAGLEDLIRTKKGAGYLTEG